MKANHNIEILLVQVYMAVINTSKIQNESKSQRDGYLIYCIACCYQYIKDTK